MRILLTGSTGQLGNALIAKKPSHINLIVPSRSELDLSNENSCRSIIEEIRPDWVINSGAYTAVDKAESDRNLVLKVNFNAPRIFSEALLKTGGSLLQISTDFVFDGKQSKPYKIHDKRSPINLYGESKFLAEKSVDEILFPTCQGIILRTSWLIGPTGRNFVMTILKLHNSRDLFNVVVDQVGSPTSTLNLADVCWKLIDKRSHSSILDKRSQMIFHWSDSGVASWYDIAKEIGFIGNELGLVSKPSIILPIPTKDYPTPANRPSYSILDCFSTQSYLDFKPLYWRRSLYNILYNYKKLNNL